ncbi:unnamed protein product [Schistosoma rodhaini]|uniref:Uncharacterized protein n=1 Tax=Schistosoma mansoni TaxID=6183 RepID=A0A5K4F4Y0_SCHMA|nr:unnamed protein product [Schistosoma rodhaini]
MATNVYRSVYLFIFFDRLFSTLDNEAADDDDNYSSVYFHTEKINNTIFGNRYFIKVLNEYLFRLRDKEIVNSQPKYLLKEQEREKSFIK